MNYPEIYQSKFGEAVGAEYAEASARVSAALLDSIVNIVRPVAKDSGNIVTAHHAWRVRLEDSLAPAFGAPFPQFVLDVGEDFSCDNEALDLADSAHILEVFYFENTAGYSVSRDGAFEMIDNRHIDQMYGTVKVTVLGEFQLYSPEAVATMVAKDYVDTKREHFPRSQIWLDPSVLRY